MPSEQKPLDIALIGCGKMGNAMLRGWLDANIENRIHVLDPQTLPSDLEDYTPNPISYYNSAGAFTDAKPKADIFVLAVKPQIMAEVIDGVVSAVPNDALILSIAAGTTIASLKSRFSQNQPIVRVMPNTPAAIGKGISVAVGNEFVSAEQKQQADLLLQSVGAVEWLDDESLLDAVTALSGSGPAYIFLLIEILTEAGKKQGLPGDLAIKLARQTVIGSAALAESEANTPAATLRKNVTSPGGTTEAALKVLMSNDALQEIFDRALAAATARGKELGA